MDYFLFSNLLSNISHIFLIIFYFIEIYESKSKSEEEGNILETIDEKINQFFHIKNIFLIIFCLIFKAIYTYNIIVFENKVKDLEIFDIVILFLMLLEIFILKKKIFSHQILSMSVIFIILIYYLILNHNESNLELSFILIILSSYTESFLYLLIKYINSNYFVNIYLLATITGVSGTIQFLIQTYEKMIKILYRFDDLKQIMMIILYFIMISINNFYFYKIISILNPFLPLIIDYTTTFIFQMILIRGLKLNDLILLFLSIIFILIYLEIIILNFCGLNDNIKENIIQRGKNEIIKELISDTDSDNNN